MTVDTRIECLWHSLQSAAPLLFNGTQQDAWDAFHFLVEHIDECLVNLGQTSLHSLCSTSYVKRRLCRCRCPRGSSTSNAQHFIHMVDAASPHDSLRIISGVQKEALHVRNTCGLEHLLQVRTELDRRPTVAVLRISRKVNVHTGVVDRLPVQLPPNLLFGDRQLKLVSTASHKGCSGRGYCTANVSFNGVWWLLDDNTTIQHRSYDPKGVTMAVYQQPSST